VTHILRYHSTNCFFLPGKGQRLMAFDVGWPCTLYEYSRLMKDLGLRFDQIAWAMVSHMHLDHAGLLGEFVNAGIECFAFEAQVAAIDDMERTILKNREYTGYVRIDRRKLKRITIGEFQDLAAEREIFGEVLATPGHSPDSVTLVTKDHEALVGDLYPKGQLMPDDTRSWQSWAAIEARGARRAFPSHADAFGLGAATRATARS